MVLILIIAAAAVPATIFLIFKAAGYDFNERCEGGAECESCPFPKCEKRIKEALNEQTAEKERV